MNTRYEAELNGQKLSELFKGKVPDWENAVVIYNIEREPPSFSRTIETPGSTDGGIVTRTYRQSASVTITFALRIYEIEARKEACMFVQAWAAEGGRLITNDMQHKKTAKKNLFGYGYDYFLDNVYCDVYPEVDSARDWTNPLTMTFTTHNPPYWQRVTPFKLTLKGTNQQGNLNVMGTADSALVSVSMTPTTDAPIHAARVSVYNSLIIIEEGINVPKGQTLEIKYDKYGNAIIGKFYGPNMKESYLSKRSADSSDQLLAKCGYELVRRTNDDGSTKLIENGFSNYVDVRSYDVPVQTVITSNGAWL